MRKLICLILALAFLPSMIAFADARTGSSNYLYTPHDEIIAAPPAYTLARSITARDIPEIDALDGLSTRSGTIPACTSSAPSA